MQRLRRAAFPVALVGALIGLGVVFLHDSAAELEASVFTARAERLRLIVPRDWRASDQPSYPGVLLWMAPPDSTGQMKLTAETFTRKQFCSWPMPCRLSRESLPSRYACALRPTLEGQRLKVGPIQAGPKENEAAGLPSIWFEYDDGKHFLRQAIAFAGDCTASAPDPTRPCVAISLLLSAATGEARATLTRGFEQALRTLRVLSAEETARAAGIDAAVAPPGDASLIDSSALADGAVLDAGGLFESSPAPALAPAIGPCPAAGSPR